MNRTVQKKSSQIPDEVRQAWAIDQLQRKSEALDRLFHHMTKLPWHKPGSDRYRRRVHNKIEK